MREPWEVLGVRVGESDHGIVPHFDTVVLSQKNVPTGQVTVEQTLGRKVAL